VFGLLFEGKKTIRFFRADGASGSSGRFGGRRGERIPNVSIVRKKKINSSLLPWPMRFRNLSSSRRHTTHHPERETREREERERERFPLSGQNFCSECFPVSSALDMERGRIHCICGRRAFEQKPASQDRTAVPTVVRFPLHSLASSA